MTGQSAAGTVWLASYPKSGSTWIRALVTAAQRGSHHFGVNTLAAGWQPHHVDAALSTLGLDARWLDADEVARLRESLVLAAASRRRLRKTHERYLRAPGSAPQLFPGTVGAVHVVRDPRDVACSLAAHFGMTMTAAVQLMCSDASRPADPARLLSARQWGSWSEHTASWTSPDLPFPVATIRYEDLHSDPMGTLLPALETVGLPLDASRMSEAVAVTSLERLRQEEAERGFVEAGPAGAPFFRRGEPGAWRHDLPPHLVEQLEAAHGPMMAAMGYQRLPTVPVSAPPVGASPRPQYNPSSWEELPEHLGITIGTGILPAALEGASLPQPWCSVTSGRVLMSMVGGVRILVTDGVRADVELPHAVPADMAAGWMVQGWVVSMAFAQRGVLTIHGSAVDLRGRVLCVAGHSGAGKSTTALGMQARGHQLLVDDVTIVEPAATAGDRPTVLPFLRGLHVLPDTAERLGIDFEALPRLAFGRRKAVYFVEDPGSRPRPLDLVAIISIDERLDDVRIERLDGAARLGALHSMTSRADVVPVVMEPDRYFRRLAALADAVPVVIVRRPAHAWSLPQVLDVLESLMP